MTYVVVGRFGKAHGVRGAVTVQSFTEPKSNIIEYSPWFVRAGSSWTELDVRLVEQRGKQIIAWVDDVESRDAASALTNQEIAVLRSALPKLAKGEFYWQQLVGLTVINLEQKKLGIVTDMMATGANDVMIVEGDKRHLIPFILGRFVQTISLETGEVVVDWDEAF